MDMMPEQNSYHLSYLVRIWKDSGDGEWHATMQDVFDGDRYHFASLHELYANLLALASEKENDPAANLFGQPLTSM